MSKFFSVLTFFVFLGTAFSVHAKDYYEILGVPKSASYDDIRKAYRKKSRYLHPDIAPDHKKKEMEKAFKELNEAHQTLKNEEARKEYDAKLSQPNFHQQKTADAYGFHDKYTTLQTVPELITKIIARMRNASAEQKIARALAEMDNLINPVTEFDSQATIEEKVRILGRVWVHALKNGYADPGTSEVMCKAFFLWLKKLNLSQKNYTQYFQEGFDFIAQLIEIEKERGTKNQWAEAKNRILAFAIVNFNGEWTPNKPTCDLF